MSVSPAEIHSIATRLWSGSMIGKTEESCSRTVAGRAYYSAYHATREALRRAYSDQTYDVGHRPLANFMIGSGNPQLRVLGIVLKELLEARERADYELTAALSHSLAEQLVDSAQDVIASQSLLESAFRSVPRRVARRATS